MMQYLMPLHREIWSNPASDVFQQPVDPIALRIPVRLQANITFRLQTNAGLTSFFRTVLMILMISL